MRRKQWSKAVATVTAAAMMVAGCIGSSSGLMQVNAETGDDIIYVDDAKLDEVLGGGNEVLTFTRNAVHDPSIVVSGDNYYVFDSHMGVSKTTDLRNWTSVTYETEGSTLFGSVSGGDVTPISYNQAFRNNAYTGKVTVLVNGVETEVDFGTYDASSWNTDPDVKDDAGNSFNVQGNMWAPDVIYNTTMNKWCMYLSLNGAKWNSSVILLTADNVEGPYVYQGPVIYSGFNGTNAVDISTTDLNLIYPDIETTGIPEKYKVGNSWGTLWPHAIDPCVSYDDNGNLYLIYGSWSGGIYAIELDETNGLRDYTVVYEDVNAGQAKVTSDAYFGKKIAGGAYVSGEGAYVEKIGNYWYLFMSYGFYSPDGGYEMRIFRSDNIDGPYVDASGESAIFPKYLMNYGSNIAAYNGEKLMGGYQWETMSVGEIAQGHNSAFTDANGNSYVVYHTKFNDGTVSHALRVHQLYVNEEGWLVAAPYEYTGETVNNSTLATTTFEANDIAGEYQLIVHKYEMDYKNMEIADLQTINLLADGTITGAYTGTWAVTNGSNVNITLDNITYNGVLVEQIIDGTANKTLCFTAKNNAGVSIWGSRNLGNEYAIALTRDALGLTNANNIFPVGGQIYQNVTLPTTGSQDAVVTWTSSNEAVLSNEGVVTVPTADTVVTMTCTVSKGNTAYVKNYDVTVMGESSRTGDIEKGLVAFFEFEGDFKDSLSDNVGVAEAQASGTAPSIKADSTINSQVVSVNFGYDGASSSNYVKINNPLKGSTTGAATVSMMVKRGDADVWDALWGFMDTDASDGVDGRYYLTPNAYIGFNGTGGWFDANHAETVTNAIPVGEWSLVTVATDANGFDIYIDGALAYSEAYTAAFGSGNGFADYASVNNLIASADTFYLGYGSWWGSAPFRADDLRFYDRALTAADVDALYDDFLACFETDDEEEGTDRTYAEIVPFQTYYNDFEEGLGDATVVGNGEVKTVDDAKYNNVYQNATANIGVRTNYLLLPSDAISNASMAGNNEMTIGFWVNPGEANVADYFYAPIFSAYGNAPTTENTWPMLVLQSRLLAQVNCAGWTDLTAAQNVAGANKESNDWLADGQWHYYAASFTEESVTVYVDGEVMNQWALDGSDGSSVSGLFTNGNELDYVCLGGNQAWNWGDADAPYMYDQVSIFSTALTAGEVKNVMNERSLAEIEGTRTYFNDFEEGLGDATVVGNGEVEVVEDAAFNNVYHNATANAGVRTNYLLLPSDAIANAAQTGSKEMSVGFWVNVADATNYWFAPIFSAYGAAPTTENTWPMMVLQSRLLAQLNCAGWTDFTAAQNVAGANQETSAWLDDKAWHYYTATFTEESVIVYVDGKVMNEWA
ncbi:MAG: family 43 glycosylhydrolase, partial [Lachnospiraceae bacterium]|nr:family 43 glycosylhydrolase [Lachnospiraceae bacterium]